MLALVTCRAARDVDTDLPLLRCELPDAAIVEWDDDAVDWSTFDTVVLRSTWDYHRRLDDFRAWASAVARVARLWNPVELIEWNTDKRYLGELERHGIRTVPTTYLSGTGHIDDLRSQGAFDGDVVVKPTVGASASGVLVVRNDPAGAARHAHTLEGRGLTPMLQPYLHAVESGGETGLVYLGGALSHAFRRRVVLSQGGVDGGVLGDERSESRLATAEERAVATR